MTFVVCENVVAITVHLRDAGDTEPNYSGFAVRPKSLCDSEIAWDTRLPLTAVRCMDCMRAASKHAAFSREYPAVVAKYVQTLTRLGRLDS